MKKRRNEKIAIDTVIYLKNSYHFSKIKKKKRRKDERDYIKIDT